MPAGIVKTADDERHWAAAKKAAAEQGHAKDYAYITGIFKRMSKAALEGKREEGEAPSMPMTLPKPSEKAPDKPEPPPALNKAGGEGSRGGQVVGHTAGGKPIYSSQQHEAAAELVGAHKRQAHLASRGEPRRPRTFGQTQEAVALAMRHATEQAKRVGIHPGNMHEAHAEGQRVAAQKRAPKSEEDRMKEWQDRVQREHEERIARQMNKGWPPPLSRSELETLIKRAEASGKQRLAGGKGDRADPRKFDRGELAQGVAVELEHTSDHLAALEVACDHLTEDGRYYTKLRTIEKAGAHPAQTGFDFAAPAAAAAKGPFIGPRGGKYQDAAHTIPWREAKEHHLARRDKHKNARQVHAKLAGNAGLPPEVRSAHLAAAQGHRAAANAHGLDADAVDRHGGAPADQISQGARELSRHAMALTVAHVQSRGKSPEAAAPRRQRKPKPHPAAPAEGRVAPEPPEGRRSSADRPPGRPLTSVPLAVPPAAAAIAQPGSGAHLRFSMEDDMNDLIKGLQDLFKAKVSPAQTGFPGMGGGGEGSRGGHVVGHTTSGKPIYEQKAGDKARAESHRAAAEHYQKQAQVYGGGLTAGLHEGVMNYRQAAADAESGSRSPAAGAARQHVAGHHKAMAEFMRNGAQHHRAQAEKLHAIPQIEGRPRGTHEQAALEAHRKAADSHFTAHELHKQAMKSPGDLPKAKLAAKVSGEAEMHGLKAEHATKAKEHLEIAVQHRAAQFHHEGAGNTEHAARIKAAADHHEKASAAHWAAHGEVPRSPDTPRPKSEVALTMSNKAHRKSEDLNKPVKPKKPPGERHQKKHQAEFRKLAAQHESATNADQRQAITHAMGRHEEARLAHQRGDTDAAHKTKMAHAASAYVEGLGLGRADKALMSTMDDLVKAAQFPPQFPPKSVQPAGAAPPSLQKPGAPGMAAPRPQGPPQVAPQAAPGAPGAVAQPGTSDHHKDQAMAHLAAAQAHATAHRSALALESAGQHETNVQAAAQASAEAAPKPVPKGAKGKPSVKGKPPAKGKAQSPVKGKPAVAKDEDDEDEDPKGKKGKKQPPKQLMKKGGLTIDLSAEDEILAALDPAGLSVIGSYQDPYGRERMEVMARGDVNPDVARMVKSGGVAGGTIYQGEHDVQGSRGGDAREVYMQVSELAGVVEDDPAGTEGQGGLPEWWRDAGHLVTVPLGHAPIAKAVEPMTQILDDNDARTRAMIRTDPREGQMGALMAYEGAGKGRGTR